MEKKAKYEGELTEKDIPKDLGIEIGSKEQVFWEGVKDKCEQAILNAKRDIEINETLILLAEQRISEEKEKFKEHNEKINK